ncbi:MAG TPA: hypothetical protein VGK67_20550 [Myxococcales bacterium]|jgi:hypothetical protein
MTRWTLVAGLLAATSLAGCNCGVEIATVPDTGVPAADGALPSNDASVLVADGSIGATDGSAPESDGALPETDGALPESDGSIPEADGSLPAVDGAVPEVDAALPGFDASAPDQDAGTPADAASPGTDASTNHAPTVTLADSFVVIEGKSLTMIATGSDPDGNGLTWTWTQTSGSPTVPLTGTSTPSASFVAPAVASNSVIEITVTVCDPAPLCASAVTKVTIDRIPTITSAIASPSPVDEGKGCALTAAALDPGDALTYAWAQTAGPAVTLAGGTTPSASFTAPLVAADTDLAFSIEVCDAFGACATGSVTVTVNDLDAPPVARATASPSPAQPYSTVTLDASGSTDPEGGALTFDWVQTVGPAVALANPTTSKATFTAALFQEDTVLTFEVKVCDAGLQCATATASVTVLGYDTFVSATGSDAAPTQCTKAKPCKTIPVAQANAVAYAYSVVRVDKGDYPGAFDMVTGVAVECGYDRTASWARTGTLSRIVTSNATGVRFPAKVNARLDGCTVNFQQPLLGTSTYATVTVEGAAAAALLNCTIDPSDPSSVVFATSTTGVGIVGPAATVTVTGGSVGGGNGMNLATGIGVAGASTLVVASATVEGSPKGSPKDAFAISITDGHASLIGVAIKPGIGLVSTTGLSATGADTTVAMSNCTVGGGSATQWTGIKMSAIKAGAVSAGTVDGGTAVTSMGGGWAYGIWVDGTGTYSIDLNSKIVGGTGSDGAIGIYSVNSAPQITGNTYIGGGTSAAEMNGIRIQGGVPNISKNAQIEGGAGTTMGVGIRVNSGSVSITDNGTVIGNAGTGGTTPTAYGIYIPPASAGSGASGAITGNSDIEGGIATGLAVGHQMSMASRMTLSRNTFRGGRGASLWSLRDGAPGGSVPGSSMLLTIDANLMEPARFVGGPVAGPTETGGVYLGSSSGSVTNNRIFAGPGATSYGVYGRGDLAFFHNYVTGGGAPGSLSKTYAMYLVGGVKVGHFDNNIFDTGRMASTRYGVYEQDGIAGFTPVEFSNNDFFPDAGQVLYHLSSPPNQDRYSAADINAIGVEYQNNLDVDPKFKDPANGDYHLDPASPVIDKGVTSLLGPATDMDGDKRPLISGGAVDIGPDEAK